MTSRFVVLSSLLTLVACGSAGDDGANNAGAGGTTAGGGTTGNAGTTGGAGINGTAGTNPGGGQNNGGGGTANGGSGGNNVGGAPGGAGGTNPGGAGGTTGGGGAGGGAGGQINIPSSCGMPVTNTVTNTCRNAAPPTLAGTMLAGTDALFAPMTMAQPPGESARLFIATRDGIVHVYKDGALLPTPFLDISDLVPGNNGENEFGLLGMTFDPGFATNRKLYLEYISDTNPFESHTATVLASEANPDVADEATLNPDFIVIPQPQGRDNHKGGMINFGSDGCLYISFGDGGSQGDPDGNGQDTGEPMASILRVDPATGMAAPGNPGYGDDRIWVYGLRNPWRTSFDSATGDFYIGDVGQGSFEEINISPAGVGDHNYGWNVSEGTNNLTAEMRAPAKALDRDEGTSVTGGYVYRGTALPDMVGRYLYGDFKSSRYWVLTYSGENGSNPEICDDYEVTADLDAINGPAAFAQDNAGEIYILTLDGPIYKVGPG